MKDHEKVSSVEGSDGLHHPESKSNDPCLLDDVQFYPHPKIIIILAYGVLRFEKQDYDVNH